MKKIYITLLVLICLTGCNSQKSQIKGLYTPYEKVSMKAKISIDSNTLVNILDEGAQSKEIDKQKNETLISHSTISKLENLKIQPIDLDTKYLFSGKNGKTNTLSISTEVQKELNIAPAEIVFNNQRTKVTNQLDYNHLYAYLAQSNTGKCMIFMCGGIGNDYGGTFIYDLGENSAEESEMIPGFIQTVDMKNGEFEIYDRKMLLGLQFMTARYHVSENGELIQDGNYLIDTDLSYPGYALTKDIKTFLYDSESECYNEVILKKGQNVRCYETDMSTRIYFLSEDNTEGYIDMVQEDGVFYVDGIDLVDYFDKHELQWAG